MCSVQLFPALADTWLKFLEDTGPAKKKYLPSNGRQKIKKDMEHILLYHWLLPEMDLFATMAMPHAQ